jgi:hypothetical protein
MTHSDAPHLRGLLWTMDRLVSKTSTWQNTTLTTDIHAPNGIRTRNSSMRAVADPRLRRLVRWDQPFVVFTEIILSVIFGKFHSNLLPFLKDKAVNFWVNVSYFTKLFVQGLSPLSLRFEERNAIVLFQYLYNNPVVLFNGRSEFRSQLVDFLYWHGLFWTPFCEHFISVCSCVCWSFFQKLVVF